MSEVIVKLQSAITAVQSKLSTFDVDVAAKRKRLEDKLAKLQGDLQAASVGVDHRPLDLLVVVVKGNELQGVLQGVSSAERSADWYKVLVGAGTADVQLVNVRLSQIKKNLTAESDPERQVQAVVPAAPAVPTPEAVPGALPEVPAYNPAGNLPEVPAAGAIGGIPGAEFQVPAV